VGRRVEKNPGLRGILSLIVRPAFRIAAAIALVVVPFGYAITGVHTAVLMGAGCGIAIGVGVSLRGGWRTGPWTGILVGSMVGVVTALLAGEGDGWGVILPPILPLAVGLIDGLGRTSLSGYREMCRETFILSVLLTLGFLPAVVAMDFSHPVRHALVAAFPLVVMPWTALMAGLLSRRRQGWRDTRPPRLLILGAAMPPTLMGVLFATGVVTQRTGFSGIAHVALIALILFFSMVVIPAAAFLLGRAAITWLHPRLRVYGRLADYLRVMWVPIGGFAVGYLTIIVLFAGFYGMLERFSPGAFAGAGTGIADWMSFAFFAALGQDFTTVAPVSVGARVLVGTHLILSAGWVVVLFAAVMSSIGPRLERIARRHGEESGE